MLNLILIAIFFLCLLPLLKKNLLFGCMLTNIFLCASLNCPLFFIFGRFHKDEHIRYWVSRHVHFFLLQRIAYKIIAFNWRPSQRIYLTWRKLRSSDWRLCFKERLFIAWQYSFCKVWSGSQAERLNILNRSVWAFPIAVVENQLTEASRTDRRRVFTRSDHHTLHFHADII